VFFVVVCVPFYPVSVVCYVAFPRSRVLSCPIWSCPALSCPVRSCPPCSGSISGSGSGRAWLKAQSRVELSRVETGPTREIAADRKGFVGQGYEGGPKRVAFFKELVKAGWSRVFSFVRSFVRSLVMTFLWGGNDRNPFDPITLTLTLTLDLSCVVRWERKRRQTG